MARKVSASSQPEKLTRKSAVDIRRFVESPKGKAELKRLRQIPDSEINYSDIPPLTDDELASMVRRNEFRPVKKAISVRLDADVLAWLKSEGAGYQTQINRLLREAMEKRRGR